MAAVDQRVEGGQVEVAGLFTAGVPASIIECPSTAHRGYQAQWSENELDVAAHFVCPTEKRNLYFTGQVWAEVAASMAWFVGFAREGTILSASSALNVNDLVGFFSPAGSAIVQAVGRNDYDARNFFGRRRDRAWAQSDRRAEGNCVLCGE